MLRNCSVLSRGTPSVWPDGQPAPSEREPVGGMAREVQVCPYVFYEMCVNSNGTYSLCRFDWNHAMILERDKTGWLSPRKIWDSITLWGFQQTFLKKRKLCLTVLSCPKCGVLKQGVPEDIDEFADEILEKM